MKKIYIPIIFLFILSITSCGEKTDIAYPESEEIIVKETSQEVTIKKVEKQGDFQIIENEAFSIQVPKKWKIKEEKYDSRDLEGVVYMVKSGSTKQNRLKFSIGTFTSTSRNKSGQTPEDFFRKFEKENKQIEDKLEEKQGPDCNIKKEELSGDFDIGKKLIVDCTLEGTDYYIEKVFVIVGKSLLSIDLDSRGEYVKDSKGVGNTLKIKNILAKVRENNRIPLISDNLEKKDLNIKYPQGIPYIPIVEDEDVRSGISYDLMEKFDDKNNLFIADETSPKRYIINALAGDDKIVTSNQMDFVRGGEGLDVIETKGGNDAVVVVGDVQGKAFMYSDITNMGGGGWNVSSLVTLEELNDKKTSDLQQGEVYDGGKGSDGLLVFGDADLSKVYLKNFRFIRVENGSITLSSDQLQSLDLRIISYDESMEKNGGRGMFKVVNSGKGDIDIYFKGNIHQFKEIFLEKGITLHLSNKIMGFDNPIKVSGEGKLDAELYDF